MIFISAPYISTDFKDDQGDFQLDVNGGHLYGSAAIGIILIGISHVYELLRGRKYYKIKGSTKKYLTKEYKKGSLSVILVN